MIITASDTNSRINSVKNMVSSSKLTTVTNAANVDQYQIINNITENTLEAAINILETSFSNNCCQSVNADCCQSCQTTINCTYTCQSCQAQCNSVCQSCQKNCN